MINCSQPVMTPAGEVALSLIKESTMTVSGDILILTV